MDIQRTLKPTNEMKMKPQPKWQDWIILVLGGILFLAPWIFGTATHAFSLWNEFFTTVS